METETKKSDLEVITERAKATGFLKEDGTIISLNEYKKRCVCATYYGTKRVNVYFGAPNTGGMLKVSPNGRIEPNTRNQKQGKEKAYNILKEILVNGNTSWIEYRYVFIREKYSIGFM
jgi:hypothetical protein